MIMSLVRISKEISTEGLLLILKLRNKNIAGGNHQSLAVLVSPCTPFQGTLENSGAYVILLVRDDMVFSVSY